MAFQPADNLANRTFFGLITAQFLAGFNDQAIHAAAMFYAIHRGLLTESQAISLMPILFFAPWAIFCTISAFLADRFSKTTAIVVWKFSEILISGLLILGFYLGTEKGMDLGVWLVLSCVFLMGMHAAFFSPAKYGAMPEVLQAHVLSKGNGVLESSTFLANILGTVSGGLLSNLLHNREVYIGVILLGLSVIGAFASLMMAKLPPSDPKKEFHPIRPLTNGFRSVFGSRPLALSVMGIAFFIFMVSYMRATLYMHGQTRVPPWDEFHTSLVVATVALGVGLGSPLAGMLSGGKIELGLVPVGCVGMIAANLVSALLIEHDVALIVSLILIGFFSGFYMVPLYSLLQHRSPKASKGEIVAVSNFVNVTGASLASVLFFLIVKLGIASNLTPEVAQADGFAKGKVANVQKDTHNLVIAFDVQASGETRTLRAVKDQVLLRLPKEGVTAGDEVVISRYAIRGIEYLVARNPGKEMAQAYDNEALPRYLFYGAAGMTLAILLLLWRKLPDFFVRSLFWFRGIGRRQIKAVGMHHLPPSGPVILATNCADLERTLTLVSATDRSTLVLMAETAETRTGSLMRTLASISSVVEVDARTWPGAATRAKGALDAGNLLAVSLGAEGDAAWLGQLMGDLRGAATSAPLVPVWVGSLDKPSSVRVVFGEAVSADADLQTLRAAVARLADWIRANDSTSGGGH